MRALTLDELRAGPVKVGSPEPYRPWTVRSTKTYVHVARDPASDTLRVIGIWRP